MAKFCHFYSMSPLDFDKMDIDLTCNLMQAIDIIESQNMLRDLKVQDFSHMKKEHRGKLHKDLYKRAYPSILKEEKALTAEDLASILNQG